MGFEAALGDELVRYVELAEESKVIYQSKDGKLEKDRIFEFDKFMICS